MTTALETRGDKSFGGPRAVRAPSLKLAQVEPHALIGANGEGARDSQVRAVYLGEAGDA